MAGTPFTEKKIISKWIQSLVIIHETSAVRLPTLVQVRSHTGPDVEDAAVVVGDVVVVAGAEVPHEPS